MSRKTKIRKRPRYESIDPQELLQKILTEDMLQFSELIKEFPPSRRPHVSSLYRWHKRGINGVRLEAVRIGGVHVSSKQALTRFLQATQGT